MLYRKYSSIVLLLVFSILVSWTFYFHDFQRSNSIKINDFPSTIDSWTSQDLPMDPADTENLETKHAFLRCYTNKQGKRVYLYITYSKSDPKASDPPEVVYEGSNISIIDKGNKYITIASSNLAFKVNWLLLDNNENQQIVYYWFKAGGIFTRSYVKEQLMAAFNNISGRKTGNALIRVSTDIADGHQKEAIDLINGFVCLIIPQLYQYLP